jgi:hypothetical protein
MSIAPSDFINITLQHTLPVVCGSCDRTVLDYMAKEIPHFNKVLANHLPVILAHIFLLPTQLGTTTALSFLEKVIGDDSEASLMLSVMKVHVYSLLAALMVKVGDEDPRISERVSLMSFDTISLSDLFFRLYLLFGKFRLSWNPPCVVHERYLTFENC